MDAAPDRQRAVLDGTRLGRVTNEGLILPEAGGA